MDNLKEKLISLGLEEKEAVIYLTSLSLGKTSILKISKNSEIKRTTVYDIVDRLIKKGLMFTEKSGWKTYYRAAHPEKIEGIIERQKVTLQNIMPELENLYKTDGVQGFIREYYGIEAVKQIYSDILKDITWGENYYVISNPEKWLQLDEEFFMSFIKKRAKFNINIKLLLQDSKTARAHQKIEKELNEEIKILPPKTELDTNLVIRKDTIIIHELVEPMKITIIKNPYIAHMHQQLFEIMWDQTK